MIVLGLGNLLLCDEGVGIHVVNALVERELLPGIELVDGGVAGFSLISLIEEHEQAVLIDAVDAPLPAGTVITLLPEEVGRRRGDKFSLHDFTVRDTLDLLVIRDTMPEMIILGIIPEDIHTYRIGLSETLEKKFEEIVEKIEKEVRSFAAREA